MNIYVNRIYQRLQRIRQILNGVITIMEAYVAIKKTKTGKPPDLQSMLAPYYKHLLGTQHKKHFPEQKQQRDIVILPGIIRKSLRGI